MERGGTYFLSQRWKVIADLECKLTYEKLLNMGLQMPQTNGKTTRKCLQAYAEGIALGNDND